MMKSLGYPRLISVENFRTPNFELVADVLFWLIHRYDPSADVSDDITTEHHRVEFLKTVAQIMYDKTNVKVNIKQLYKADGHAVKEMLK
jgi:clusterin-associated protein 1